MNLKFATDCLNDATWEYDSLEIFNSDQNSQFISNDFKNIFADHAYFILILMDSQGRAYNKITMEGFWGELKAGRYLHEWLCFYGWVKKWDKTIHLLLQL